jgi:ABC-type Zn uptake system ZnuABC Zn-binding protein ZnuA
VIKPPLIAVLVLSLATIIAACGGDDEGDGETDGTPAALEEKLRVVSTVAPITSLAENIGGTKIELEGIVPEGTNSHTFEPPPSIVSSVADADLIIINGLQLEEPTLELAEANKSADAQILLLGDRTVTAEEYKYDFSFPEEDGKPNPHLWPDPRLATEYATLIHEKLVELDPANKEYYDTNYNELKERLEVLDQQMVVAVQTVPEENRKLLTYHDSWAYWADNYGMVIIGAIQPSDFAEPSASEVADLIDQVKAENLPAIFGSEVFPSDVLETIANETGAEYVDDLRDDDLPGEPGDPLHSYIGLMKQNMEVMIPALGGDASPMGRVDPSLVFDEGESTAEYPQ